MDQHQFVAKSVLAWLKSGNDFRETSVKCGWEEGTLAPGPSPSADTCGMVRRIQTKVNLNHHLISCVLFRYLHLGLHICIMDYIISFVQIVMSVQGSIDAVPSTVARIEQVHDKEQLQSFL